MLTAMRKFSSNLNYYVELASWRNPASEFGNIYEELGGRITNVRAYLTTEGLARYVMPYAISIRGPLPDKDEEERVTRLLEQVKLSVPKELESVPKDIENDSTDPRNDSDPFQGEFL